LSHRNPKPWDFSPTAWEFSPTAWDFSPTVWNFSPTVWDLTGTDFYWHAVQDSSWQNDDRLVFWLARTEKVLKCWPYATFRTKNHAILHILHRILHYVNRWLIVC
jgi:hypothetical protein